MHHVNRDRHDNSPGNLVICQDAQYHATIERRGYILEAFGRPDVDAEAVALLRNRLDVLGLQKLVAAELGISRPHLIDLLRGTRVASIELLRRIGIVHIAK